MKTPVRHAETTPSTNEDARAAFDAAPPVGRCWFTAGEQTQGKGRRGREWVHDPGNLAATLLLPVEQAHLRWAPSFSFIAALSVAEAADACGLAAERTKVKWPNDVLVDGQKLAGILCELLTGPKGYALTVGIGVNLATSPAAQGEAAISLSAALGQPAPPPPEFLQHLDDRFVFWWGRFKEDGFAPIRTAWLARAAGLGGAIIARLQSETQEGIFAGIDEDGALSLDQGGEVCRITAADVFLGPGNR